MLQTRAVEFAKKYGVRIHVRNSQNTNPGTLIVAETPNMEHIVVSGAALKTDLTRVTIKAVPDRPGIAAKIFGDIAAANIVVDDIIQNVFDDHTANIGFTVERGDLHDIRPVVDRLCRELGAPAAPIYQGELSKVSVVGVGMRTHTGVAERMFKALADAEINIQNITTSEIRISCIIASRRRPPGPAAGPRRVRPAAGPRPSDPRPAAGARPGQRRLGQVDARPPARARRWAWTWSTSTPSTGGPGGSSRRTTSGPRPWPRS